MNRYEASSVDHMVQGRGIPADQLFASMRWVGERHRGARWKVQGWAGAAGHPLPAGQPAGRMAAAFLCQRIRPSLL